MAPAEGDSACYRVRPQTATDGATDAVADAHNAGRFLMELPSGACGLYILF